VEAYSRERIVGFTEGRLGLWETLQSWLHPAPTDHGPVEWAGEALFPARETGSFQWGYIRADGRWVLPCGFGSAGVFSEGVAIVSTPEGTALVNGAGALTPLDFHVAGIHEYWGGSPGRCSCGRIRAQGKMQAVYLDKSGRQISIRLTDSSRFPGSGMPFSDDRAVLETWEKGTETSRSGSKRSVFVDLDGTQVTPDFFDARPFAEGLAPVHTREGWGYLDPEANWVLKPQFESATPFSDGLAQVSGRRVIDRAGKTVFTLDGKHRVEPFAEGRAAVNVWDGKNHRHGYLAADGSFAVPAKFSRTQAFSEGVGAVLHPKEGWGYIDRDGAFAIPPGFSEAGPFVDGLARVAVSIGKFDPNFGTLQREGYIDREGSWVRSWEKNRPPPVRL